MVGLILLLVIVFFFLFYGYHLLVNRKPANSEDAEDTAQCHLCKRQFPISQMVARDKEAGFVNYFCGDCIEKLYADYIALGEACAQTEAAGKEGKKELALEGVRAIQREFATAKPWLQFLAREA